MLFLMVASAFFSLSEAAFFSLSRSDRKLLAQGGRFAQNADRLLHDSERLLTTILLGNQVVNFLFFIISTVVVFQMNREGLYAKAGLFAVISLLGVILFSEMFPKDIGILLGRRIVGFSAIPLAVLVKVLSPALSCFEKINRISTRVFLPGFRKESYLRIRDLEQAIELSKSDATLSHREQKVLHNILRLSLIKAEELMCPRKLLHFMKPPVDLDRIVREFQGEPPKTGYVLISEKDSEELASAISLSRIVRGENENNPLRLPEYQWDERSDPVLLVPWSLSAAEVLDEFTRADKDVAAVLNEFGETIGIITIEDIFEMIFGRQTSRSRKLLNRSSITQIEPGIWYLTGLTSLRRLQNYFHIPFPSQSSFTVAGFLQEQLERLPKEGDRISFNEMQFHVLELFEEGGMLVEVRKNDPGITTPERDRS